MSGSDWGGGGWGWGGSLCQWPLLVPHEGPHHTPAALPGPPPALPGPTEYSGTPDVTGWFYIHTYIYIYIVQHIFVLHRRRCPLSPKKGGAGVGGGGEHMVPMWFGHWVARTISRVDLWLQWFAVLRWVVHFGALRPSRGARMDTRNTHTHIRGHTHTHTVTLTRTPPPPPTHTHTHTDTRTHTHTLWTRKVLCGTGSFKIFLYKFSFIYSSHTSARARARSRSRSLDRPLEET